MRPWDPRHGNVSIQPHVQSGMRGDAGLAASTGEIGHDGLRGLPDIPPANGWQERAEWRRRVAHTADSADDDVHQAAADVDDLDHRVALQVRPDLGSCQDEPFDL